MKQTIPLLGQPRWPFCPRPDGARWQLCRIDDIRPLSYKERWQLFRRTMERQRYSARHAAVLLGFLVAGVVAWEMGAGSDLLQSKASPARRAPAPPIAPGKPGANQSS
jgi:hypothetical protein